MLLPAEIETKTSVPALRALVAKKLIYDYKFSQKDTAKLIGITQAAVSNYLRGTRGNLTSLGDDLSLIHISEPTRPERIADSGV